MKRVAAFVGLFRGHVDVIVSGGNCPVVQMVCMYYVCSRTNCGSFPFSLCNISGYPKGPPLPRGGSSKAPKDGQGTPRRRLAQPLSVYHSRFLFARYSELLYVGKYGKSSVGRCAVFYY